MWPGWVRVPLPSFVPRVKRPTTIWGAFALGAVFFDRRLPGLYAGACHPEQIPKRFRDSRGRDAYRIRPLHAERILFLDTVARDMRATMIAD